MPQVLSGLVLIPARHHDASGLQRKLKPLAPSPLNLPRLFTLHRFHLHFLTSVLCSLVPIPARHHNAPSVQCRLKLLVSCLPNLPRLLNLHRLLLYSLKPRPHLCPSLQCVRFSVQTEASCPMFPSTLLRLNSLYHLFQHFLT